MPEKYRPEGSTVEYVIPSLDDPADGPVAFKDFADSIPPALSPVVPIHVKTADYTLTAADDGSLVSFDCTSKDLNVTVPKSTSVDFPVGSVIVVGCLGTNRKSSLTIIAEDGVTLRDLAVRKVAWSRMAALIKIEQDSWIINAGTGGGTPTSVPSPPALLTAAAGAMQAGVTWKAPTDDGGSALSAYLIEISKDQKTWETGASTGPTTLAANVPIPEGGVTWYFRAKAVNANGISDPSNILSADIKLPFNEAKGGTETFYEKNGKRFKVHTFSQSGTFTVTKAVNPFRVLCVGGGGGGGGTNSPTGGGGGGGGSVIDKDTPLPIGQSTVTVGNGGPGGNDRDYGGGGSPSSIDTISAGGGGGGAENGGTNAGGQGPSGGTSSDITGVNVQCGQNGGASGNQSEGGSGGFPGGGGRGAVGGYGIGRGADGQKGVVIVSYEVALEQKR